MAVRPELPWYWRIAMAALFVVAVGSAVFAVFGRDAKRAASEREVAELQQTLQRQESELADLRSKAAQADRQVQMDRADAGDLAKQVKALTFENAKLKEDLAFFQSLMSSSTAREGTISVNRFKLQPEAVGGEYRYQLLLVQTGQRAREFHGSLQFVLDVQQDGRKLALILPPPGERDARDYRLSFKLFQRLEGTFKLAPGSVLKGMQVRVFENGARTPKLIQALNVS
jgi:septal ring factor EnvC (AmiA/AmiB activator)